MDVIHRKLAAEGLVVRTPLLPAGRIAELLQLCLKSTYFSYNGEFYEQRQGAAMGSTVSVVVATIKFTMELEEDPFLNTKLTRRKVELLTYSAHLRPGSK